MITTAMWFSASWCSPSVGDSLRSLKNWLRSTEAAKFSAIWALFDSVVCSMVISYITGIGYIASIKTKIKNSSIAKNDCKGVSGSIIKSPVLVDESVSG